VGIKTLRGDEWEIDSEIVLREGKVYVPKNEALRLVLRTLTMDFNLCFPFHFIYLSFSFLVYFLFLELRLGFSDKDNAIT